MRSAKYVIFWILFLVAITAYFWREPLNDVGTPVLVVIPVGFLLWLLYRERSKRKQFKLPPDLRFRNFRTAQQQADSDLSAHSDLVGMCLGDVAKVERLIRFEQSKRPGLSRAQATRAARDRLKYDRQR